MAGDFADDEIIDTLPMIGPGIPGDLPKSETGRRRVAGLLQPASP